MRDPRIADKRSATWQSRQRLDRVPVRGRKLHQVPTLGERIERIADDVGDVIWKQSIILKDQGIRRIKRYDALIGLEVAGVAADCRIVDDGRRTTGNVREVRREVSRHIQSVNRRHALETQ